MARCPSYRGVWQCVKSRLAAISCHGSEIKMLSFQCGACVLFYPKDEA